MKTRNAILLVLTAGIPLTIAVSIGTMATAGVEATPTTAAPGATPPPERPPVSMAFGKPLMEGPIHFAAYDVGNGKLGGFVRIDNPEAVPGGNGTWNVDRYGKLYRDYLVVTDLSNERWGVQVIPTSRIYEIHFSED